MKSIYRAIAILGIATVLSGLKPATPAYSQEVHKSQLELSAKCSLKRGSTVLRTLKPTNSAYSQTEVKPAASIQQGVEKFATEDGEEAIEEYHRLLRMNPESAEAYVLRGYARSKLNDRQGAIEDYNQAIAIDPNLAKAYVSRGVDHYNLGDKQVAIEDLQKASNLLSEQGDNGYKQQVMTIIKLIQETELPNSAAKP